MNLLLYGSAARGSTDLSLQNSFEKLGVNVVFFDCDREYERGVPTVLRGGFLGRITRRFLWRILARPLQRAFVKYACEVRPSYVFVSKGWLLSPRTVRKIKNALPDSTIVCFNPDNPFNTWHHGISNSWVRATIPLYHIYFIWGRFLIPRLEQLGAKHVVYLPFAYQTELHYPVTLAEDEKERYRCEAAFIGSWDKEREVWLRPVAQAFNLKIWGNGWGRCRDERLRECWQGSDAVGETFSRVCAGAKVNINLLRRNNYPAHNMRIFEVTACGGFLLSTRTEEQEQFFHEGSEIACFASPEELHKKITYYLFHDEERVRVASAGYNRSLPHSFLDRAKRILLELAKDKSYDR